MPRPRKTGEQPLWTIKLGAKKYEVYNSRLTAVDVGDLRRATGHGMAQLSEQVNTSPDLDTLAAIMWLHRRQNGEPKLRFDEVASEVTGDTYAVMRAEQASEPGDEEDDEEPNSPEA